MGVRQQRPDLPKKVAVGVSMEPAMKAEIQAQADREGHRNLSAVVIKAVREYLDRVFTNKEAHDADRAA